MAESPKPPSVPTAATVSRLRRAARRPTQYLLAVLLLAYASLGWRYADALFRFFSMGIVSAWIFLLIYAGSAALLAGVARHVYNACKGTYFFLLAALLLAYAAFSIGNWDYLIGKILTGQLTFGCLLGVFGAWLSVRAKGAA